MEVRTTRFGTVNIADDRIIHLPKGLLGFGGFTRFCLLEPADDACFFWLQSVEEPSLAFVVTDPNFFVPDYSVPIRQEQADELGIKSLSDAQVFVIVNKVDNLLTGNLQGPVVINTLTRTGEQFVLAEKRWTTRHPLLKLNAAPNQQAMSA
ncbi:MAG: flagellar assembly protein FliW [Phycisphaerales bacterium]|nr:flagellar assembly protein FliW [Phycisphaerales bacterium]